MSNTSEIRYIKHQNIDTEKWDECVDNAENRRIYATHWHLDRTAEYWDALVLGDYEYVMPLPVKKNGAFRMFISLCIASNWAFFLPPARKLPNSFMSRSKHSLNISILNLIQKFHRYFLSIKWQFRHEKILF